MNTISQINKYKYALRYYEKDLNRYLKPVSMFNFMQDVATMHAEGCGFGPSFVFSHNLAWFVLKYKLVIYKNINDLEEIEIKTESRGINKLFANRDFYFYNNGEIFAKASSIWVLVDFDTKKIVKPMEFLSGRIPVFEKREEDLEYDKIPSVDENSPELMKKEFRIRFDDIDINQHVNNPNYLAWALETLDYDFRFKNVMKSMDIYFKKEIAFGGEILSSASINKDENYSIHSIKNAQTNEELCCIKIEWEPASV